MSETLTLTVSHFDARPTMMKAGRKRKADGRLVKSASDARLSFRDSLYSEKAAAMIESTLNKSEPTSATSTSSTSPKEDVAAGAFQFVDQSASSRREARRFVMRRSVWHRKQEQTKRLQGKSPAATRVGSSSPPLAWTQQPSSSSSPSTTISQRPAPPKLTIDTQPKAMLPYDPVRGSMSAQELTPTPRTLMSAARKDPFDTLPIKIDDWDLIDFFHAKVGYRSGTMDHLKNVMWKQVVYDKVTFHATCLAYAAGHRAQCLPTEANVRSARHYMSTIDSELDQYLRTSSDSDSIRAEKYATVRVSQAMCEGRFGSAEVSHKHISSAITLLQQRGSLHPVVTTWMHFVFFMTQIAAPPSSIYVTPVEASMFTTFLQNVERLSILQSNNTWSTRVPLRSTLFHPGSAMYTMLAPLPPTSPEERTTLIERPWDICKGRQDKLQALARLAVLLYLNAALLDLRDSYENTAAYLEHIHHVIRGQRFDSHPSVESFVFSMLEQEPNPETRNGQRALLVGKMVRITRKMNPQVCDWLSDVLLDCLALRRVARMPEMEIWEESLQQEMMKSPDQGIPISVV